MTGTSRFVKTLEFVIFVVTMLLVVAMGCASWVITDAARTISERDAVIRTLSDKLIAAQSLPPADLHEKCSAWWFGTEQYALETKRRICGTPTNMKGTSK